MNKQEMTATIKGIVIVIVIVIAIDCCKCSIVLNNRFVIMPIVDSVKQLLANSTLTFECYVEHEYNGCKIAHQYHDKLTTIIT